MFFQNHINIEGRLVQNPDVKTSKNGVTYCRFSICYNQTKKDKDSNEWISIPHFFNCVCFNKTAEALSKFKKGDPVTIEGSLQFSKYEKNGESESSVSISVKNIKKLFLEKKDKTKDYTPEPNTKPQEPLRDDLAVTLSEDYGNNPDFPEEIPF